MPLDATDLAKVAEVVRGELSAAAMRSDAILTTLEAMVYAKTESASAFYRWCVRWKVKSITNGRWSREQLDLGLKREASKVNFRPRCRPKFRQVA